MPENPLRMSFKRNPGGKTGKIPRGRGKYLPPAQEPRSPPENTVRLQQKTPSQREGVSYLYGSNELTAEVVEQDVL